MTRSTNLPGDKVNTIPTRVVCHNAYTERFSAFKHLKARDTNVMSPTCKAMIYYMNSDYIRDGLFGYDFLKKINRLPNVMNYESTHTYLGSIDDSGLDSIYAKMQGENWSPNGEAKGLILSLNLNHTSMSVGDIVVIKTGASMTPYIVDIFGFRNLLTGKDA